MACLILLYESPSSRTSGGQNLIITPLWQLKEQVLKSVHWASKTGKCCSNMSASWTSNSSVGPRYRNRISPRPSTPPGLRSTDATCDGRCGWWISTYYTFRRMEPWLFEADAAENRDVLVGEFLLGQHLACGGSVHFSRWCKLDPSHQTETSMETFGLGLKKGALFLGIPEVLGLRFKRSKLAPCQIISFNEIQYFKYFKPPISWRLLKGLCLNTVRKLDSYSLVSSRLKESVKLVDKNIIMHLMILVFWLDTCASLCICTTHTDSTQVN